MTRPGIRKSLEAMKALCVSVIFSEHSFRDNPRNTQCSNATAIDCTMQAHCRLYQIAVLTYANAYRRLKANCSKST